VSANDNYFKHPLAVVESPHVGTGTRISAFAHVRPGARIGADCTIGDHVFIESDVTVGDRVTITSRVQLWDGVAIEDDVFVGPNVAFTDDPAPTSRPRADVPRTLLRKGASIGANATILLGVTIGHNAIVGDEAVVMQDVPANSTVVGNPASVKGSAASRMPGKVSGVRTHRLPVAADACGSLAVAELGRALPFEVRRYFAVYGVRSREVRGQHAHRQLHQFLTCVAGRCALLVDDGTSSEEVLLDTPSIGVHVPPMIWGVQSRFSSDAVLVVLASAEYDPADYIRDYDEFLEALRTVQSGGRRQV
jgi:acetyltransferase-like isoleucine patch superfamily enzyme/dTDP-4-dehydrorhamnose 3,5-epimerase-like enzyme